MKSLDEIDRKSFGAGVSPAEKTGKIIVLKKGTPLGVEKKKRFSLDGTWQIAMEGNENSRLQAVWQDAIPADIPCGIHAALFKAGVIPDPLIGDNQTIAREYSYKTWWYKKEFDFTPLSGRTYILNFDGVADACTVWLNGEKIGTNRGMFGGPRIDISSAIRAKNILTVKTEPIPFVPVSEAKKRPENIMNNWSWSQTVVINNVYGWHYSNMPSVGIWQPVYIEEEQEIELNDPFIFTRNAGEGKMSLVVPVTAKVADNAEFRFSLSPLNFTGDSFVYTEEISLKAGKNEIQYEFAIPNPRLWWPTDMGEQNLHYMEISISSGGKTSTYRHQFGIRTVEMAPLPQGPKEDLYNWTFVINGKKTFIKGTGWCTPDALLDLSRERYERFIKLVHEQHSMMMRAWGCGLPEKDDFYDLCDMYGIMIMQEWPTAWDSHNTQPFEMLEKTVRDHTLRLRNYPSLVMYGAGNESPNPFGKAIDMMGRLSIELDGTRPYHRGEPWGGSQHDYSSHWGRKHVDAHLVIEAPFWGEFGTPSIPVLESFKKYMQQKDMAIFPLDVNNSFKYHTPIFSFAQDISRIYQLASMFLRKNYTWKELIAASQLVQVLVLQRVLERSRARYPECSGALYYKMNDNFPAASWAVVDWYGAQKFAYYSTQDAFEPVHAVVLFDRLNFFGQPVMLPVHLCDENGEIGNEKWEVLVRAYDGNLKRIKETVYSSFSKAGSSLIGTFDLEAEETATEPLFIIADVRVGNKHRSRAAYFSNVEGDRGCLFNLPRASITIENRDHSVVVKNIGSIPAYGVWLHAPAYSEKASFSDNFLWLEPGESVDVTVENVDPATVEVEALNSINR